MCADLRVAVRPDVCALLSLSLSLCVCVCVCVVSQKMMLRLYRVSAIQNKAIKKVGHRPASNKCGGVYLGLIVCQLLPLVWCAWPAVVS